MTKPPHSTGPLSGVRVVDLSRVLAGPFCCQTLGDLGADVVKVERPDGGDDTRQWGPPFVGDDGPSAYYLSTNRNKRSVALDLNNTSGRAALDDLLRTADVVIENFLPRTLKQFKLTPADAHAINSRLVVVSISGFGRTGPLADEPGYDLAIQAAAGLMSITGEPNSQPMKVGVAMTDVLTGLYAAISALVGLRARDSGEQNIAYDLSLADCTLSSLVNVAQAALVTGLRPQRFGNAHPHIVPYEPMPTADGHIVLAIGADRQWRRFCEAVGRSDWLDDPRLATNPLRVANREWLIPQLQTLFTQKTTDQWSELLKNADVPCAPVESLDGVLASQQTVAREMIQQIDVELSDDESRPVRLLASPIHRVGHPAPTVSSPPPLGAHTGEVFRDWCDYDDEKLSELQASGAFGDVDSHG